MKSCAVYTKHTILYIENIRSKDHPTVQQNTNHKFGTKPNTDLRERRDTDNTFEMKFDINLLRERRRAGDRQIQ